MSTTPQPTPENAALALEVYETLFAQTESWKEDDRGMHIAYLMGAILRSDTVQFFKELDPGEQAAYDLYVLIFPEGHPVWKFIEVLDE